MSHPHYTAMVSGPICGYVAQRLWRWSAGWRERRRERRRALRMIAGSLRCIEEWKRGNR